VIHVADAPRFRAALEAIAPLHTAQVVASRGYGEVSGVHDWAELLGPPDEAAVDRALHSIGSDTVAKLLFTSGSTGSPKGVINTQRMLCANQQQIRQIWPFTDASPPVIVDWLPWSHTFGGNHNFNLVLRAGGTLYIDDGRPVPGLFERTVANLEEIAPTIYLNVPRGYDLLVAALRSSEALRRNFFSRLQVLFYAAAALPQHLWEALEQLAVETTGERIVLVSSWGATETAPMAVGCHFRAERAGIIGLPVPGCELKLVPAGDKIEVRVRGPNVMPGYWKLPELTAAAFDEDGFYRIGDAVRLVDERRPELGLSFDGRISEDFKLTTGTWVNVGGLRIRAIAALDPVAQDIVVAGQDRDSVGFLVFPNLANCRRLCPDLPPEAGVEEVLASAPVRRRVREGLERLRRDGGGSSSYAARAMLLAQPPSIDAGEITDKGYINQRAVLAVQSAAVERLYSPTPDAAVVILGP
jgi:feruloyl-CoA synthase